MAADHDLKAAASPARRAGMAGIDAFSAAGHGVLVTAFTAGLSTDIVPYNRNGLVRRRMRFGQRQLVDADV
jgi:hypothetical protein